MIETIKKRRSIREYNGDDISEKNIKILLEAGMSGPSCVNAQDWAFIVVKDKNVLNELADANGVPAKPLRGANIAIVVCGDLNKAFIGAKDYWIIDSSIATQNIILAATELNIGSVWLGTYPQMERVNRVKSLLNLPENIIPHSIISLGYPLNSKELELGNRSSYNEKLVHRNKW